MRKIESRMRKVRLLLLDVDGVMTDGKVILGPGKMELKEFHAHDGLGIALAKAAGLLVGIITARDSEAVKRRAKELGIDSVKQGFIRKEEAYEELLKKHGLRDEEVAYIGDDLLDLPLMRRVGFSISVSNGVDELKRAAHYVTKKRGGEGAIREVVELLLAAQGKKEAALAAIVGKEKTHGED